MVQFSKATIVELIIYTRGENIGWINTSGMVEPCTYNSDITMGKPVQFELSQDKNFL